MVKGEWISDLALVLGHEGAGVVEEVGKGVTAVEPGDHVVLSWMPNYGRCAYCITGRPHLCDDAPEIDRASGMWRGDLRLNLFAHVASFAQYTLVPESGAIPICEEIPLDRASLLGCRVMTGVEGATNTARVRPGSAVAVFGCGGVGLNVIQGAVVGGAGRIMAVDLTVDIPRSVDLYLEGKLDLDTPIAHRYALEEVNEAFAAMGRGVIAFPGLPVVAST